MPLGTAELWLAAGFIHFFKVFLKNLFFLFPSWPATWDDDGGCFLIPGTTPEDIHVRGSNHQVAIWAQRTSHECHGHVLSVPNVVDRQSDSWTQLVFSRWSDWRV